MSNRYRPRRSMLFMPATNARAIEKARILDCDGVILDLEDAVPPDRKDEAREAARAAVEAGGWGHREVVIRVNPPESDWGKADIAAVAAAGPEGMLLPKITSADALIAAERMLAAGDGPGARKTRLWVMMETPKAILDAGDIAAATDRLEAMVMGTEDLAKALHAASPAAGRTPFLASLSLVLLAARAHGLTALDGVFTRLADDEGFARECAQGAAMGFDGKTLLHPRQLAAANDAFRPDAAAVDRARRLVQAWRVAESGGAAIAVFEGEMVERLHAEEAERLIAIADAIAARTE